MYWIHKTGALRYRITSDDCHASHYLLGCLSSLVEENIDSQTDTRNLNYVACKVDIGGI
jgi:hypothetical protein